MYTLYTICTHGQTYGAAVAATVRDFSDNGYVWRSTYQNGYKHTESSFYSVYVSRQIDYLTQSLTRINWNGSTTNTCSGYLDACFALSLFSSPSLFLYLSSVSCCLLFSSFTCSLKTSKRSNKSKIKRVRKCCCKSNATNEDTRRIVMGIEPGATLSNIYHFRLDKVFLFFLAKVIVRLNEIRCRYTYNTLIHTDEHNIAPNGIGPMQYKTRWTGHYRAAQVLYRSRRN